MNFKLKALVGAAVMAVAGLASAGPLGSLAGPYSWKLQGSTTEYHVGAGYGAGALAETTWGIGEVTQINTPDGDPGWSRGEGGDFLYYMLYGIADLSIVPDPITGQLRIYNVGCTGGVGCDGKIHLDVYRHTSSLSGILNRKPSDRTSFNQYAGVTDAPGSSLYLALEFDIGKVGVDEASTMSVDERLATLFQQVTSDVLPASGNGTFFASAVGGSAQSQWNTNAFNSGRSDFNANYTLQSSVCANIVGNLEANCFRGLINDPVDSLAVPEPGSLALAGLALLGLGLSARRKRAA